MRAPGSLSGAVIRDRGAAASRRLLKFLALAIAALTAGSPAGAAILIKLDIDATDIAHAIQHAHLVIPVRPGLMTLAYPKWVPGEHAPNGPITQLMNLHIAANGRALAWRRDPLDAFSFRVDVPPGARALDVDLDYFSPPIAFGPGFGETPNSTPHLLIVSFSQLVIYPADAAARSIDVKARVRVPAHWTIDGALSPEPVATGDISLPVASLSTLVDSPLIAGEYFRSVPVTPGPGGARISLSADAPGDLGASDALIDRLRDVVAQAAVLFGPAHYRRYVWLVSLSDRLGHDGTEHHESSDVREAEALFTDPAYAIDWRLFPHEYAHSWNGKYRRPAGLDTANFQQPMSDDLLWVYEGLTRYYADLVLTARSGLATPEQSREYLAYAAALMDRDRPGRAWRTLADTAVAEPTYDTAPGAWSTIRRGTDYYNEMLLVWLEADMAIRASTADKKSLDDFCLRFFSGPERAPAIRRYGRSDVLDALRGVAPLDWDAFLTARVDAINPRAPLGGLAASGWSLTYDDEPNAFLEDVGKTNSSDNLSLSLGLWAAPDGEVQDVVGGSVAFAAGIAPGMRLLDIDGRKWTAEAARDEILKAERTPGPIELTVAFGDLTRVLRLGYHAGLRYPHLKRDAERPDLLGEVLAPRRPTSQRADGSPATPITGEPAGSARR